MVSARLTVKPAASKPACGSQSWLMLLGGPQGHAEGQRLQRAKVLATHARTLASAGFPPTHDLVEPRQHDAFEMLGDRSLDVDQLAGDLIAIDELARLVGGLEAEQPVRADPSPQQPADMSGMRTDEDDAICDL